MRYSIGEFAELGGVTTKTLRFYDEIGLLRPAAVNPRTRYRHYLPAQLNDLAAILALKDLGLSLVDIHSAVGKSGLLHNRRRVLENLKKKIEQSMREAAQSLQWIDAALEELNRPSAMNPVVVKRQPAARIASIRAKVNKYEDIVQIEAELLRAVPESSIGNIRGVLWHKCADSGALEGEPFVELKREIMQKSLFQVRELPAITAACAYSGLDENSAESAYGSIRRWMRVRDYRLGGAMRELYLGPMLEIQFPLQST